MDEKCGYHFKMELTDLFCRGKYPLSLTIFMVWSMHYMITKMCTYGLQMECKLSTNKSVFIFLNWYDERYSLSKVLIKIDF